MKKIQEKYIIFNVILLTFTVVLWFICIQNSDATVFFEMIKSKH